MWLEYQHSQFITRQCGHQRASVPLVSYCDWRPGGGGLQLFGDLNISLAFSGMGWSGENLLREEEQDDWGSIQVPAPSVPAHSDTTPLPPPPPLRLYRAHLGTTPLFPLHRGPSGNDSPIPLHSAHSGTTPLQPDIIPLRLRTCFPLPAFLFLLPCM